MANEGRPECLNESCDGHLHREFLTGLTQSTAQMMRIGGLALIVGPVVFGAPFIVDYMVRRSAGMTGMIATLAALAIPFSVGIAILRKRAAGLAQKSEQQRCNKCGSVFPVAS